MKTVSGLLLAVLVAPCVVLCAEKESGKNAISPSAVAEQSDERRAGEEVSQSSEDIVEEKISGYAKKLGIRFGKSKNGVVYWSKVAQVRKSPPDPRFIDDRQITFEKALHEIYTDFVMYEFGRNVEKTLSVEQNDDSSDIENPSEGFKAAVTGIKKKIAALGEAKLDQALEEAGVDPTVYDGKGVQEKREIYRQMFMRESLKRAFGSAAGIQVVDTFEGHDKSGGYSIGIIAKLSPQNRIVIDCIARQVEPDVKRKGIRAEDYLEKISLVDSVGCRLFYDENGRPGLISIGHSGYTPQNDRLRDGRMRRFAQQSAENAANAFMTETLNLNLSVHEAAQSGQESAENVVFTENKGNVENTREAIDNYVKRSAKTSKGFAAASLAGRSVILQKVLPHPETKQKVAVCAVLWSFDTMDEIKKRRQNDSGSGSAPGGRSGGNGTDGVRSGGALDAGLDW